MELLQIDVRPNCGTASSSTRGRLWEFLPAGSPPGTPRRRWSEDNPNMPLSRRLHLLRHAKSSWDDAMQSDHDRPLAPRGTRAGQLLHHYVREHEIRPQLVLCSTARRTVETVRTVDPGGELSLEPRLYGASAEELLRRLRDLDAGLNEVMVVGHNPALQMLVLKLVADTANTDLLEIRRKLPTGALVSLAFDGDWADLSPASAQLTGYVRPKALQYS
jgi:phosphohistidine phosphatase